MLRVVHCMTDGRLGLGAPSHERVPAPFAPPATAVPAASCPPSTPAVVPRRPAVAPLSPAAAGPPSASAAWRAAAGPPAFPALWRAPRRNGRAARASTEGAAWPIHRCGKDQEGAWAAAEPTRSYVLRCGFQCVVCTEP